ncbi:hypothetical protein A3Q56_06571 [Intoshia linei]|uniref:Phosphoacetylglucosamine mutase n=1 Tax=Intoshia linei TaxID=1819745 RepID=A0A177AV65_9BILA|nr:hypothetical protein A3Q56_06571 [Intoshia linei]
MQVMNLLTKLYNYSESLKNVTDSVRINQTKLFYGTSGFRVNNSFLDWITVRMTFLCVLRSVKKKSQTVGIAITASHNPEPDNGLKIIDCNGELLDVSWERYCNDFVHASNLMEFTEAYNNLISNEFGKLNNFIKVKAHIMIVQDTRPSGIRIKKEIYKTLDMIYTNFNYSVFDLGEMGTPACHWLVGTINKTELDKENYIGELLAYYLLHYKIDNSRLTEIAEALHGPDVTHVQHLQYNVDLLLKFMYYYDMVFYFYKNLINIYTIFNLKHDPDYTLDCAAVYDLLKNKCTQFVVDCGNGIGTTILDSLNKLLYIFTYKDDPGDILTEFYNFKLKDYSELILTIFKSSALNHNDLNRNCGADYVKTLNEPPLNIAAQGYPITEHNLVSFDGDADRFIGYYFDELDQFHMLDGDQISIFFVCLIKEILKINNIDDIGGLLDDENINDDNCVSRRYSLESDAIKPSLCVVKTLYTNGAFTNHLKASPLNFNYQYIINSETGIKNLHEVAKKHAIGVYFEANGHGTALFSLKSLPSYVAAVKRFKSLSKKSERYCPFELLQNLTFMVNQYTGDAVSVLFMTYLVIEYFHVKSFGISDDEYTKNTHFSTIRQNHETKHLFFNPMPNKTVNIGLGDIYEAEKFNPDDIDSYTFFNKSIQDNIDHICFSSKDAVSYGRCFIRKSGTQNVVRIYAEAYTQELLDNIVNMCIDLLT